MSGIEIVEAGKGEQLCHLRLYLISNVIDPGYIPDDYEFIKLFDRWDEIGFEFGHLTRTNIKLNGAPITTEDLDTIAQQCVGFSDMICPECGCEKPDDRRVKHRMKCGACAGYTD